MCNLSEWVFDLGVQRGMQQGMQKTREIVMGLLKEETVTEDLILRVTGITQEELNKIKNDMLIIA